MEDIIDIEKLIKKSHRKTLLSKFTFGEKFKPGQRLKYKDKEFIYSHRFKFPTPVYSKESYIKTEYIMKDEKQKFYAMAFYSDGTYGEPHKVNFTNHF